MAQPVRPLPTLPVAQKHSPAPQPGSTGTQRFAAAAIGAGIAEGLTLPVDAAKVRLQMQVVTGATRSAPAKPVYTGLLQAMYRIGADEGVGALWRGVEPALVRQCSYTGMSFLLYEPVRNFYAGDTPKNEIPFYKVRHSLAYHPGRHASSRALSPLRTPSADGLLFCAICNARSVSSQAARPAASRLS